MKSFSLEYIRSLTRLATFNNAEQLYQTKKITLLKIDEQQTSDDEKELMIYCQVATKHSGDYYDVNVVFALSNNLTFLTRQNCSCIDYNFQHQICQHIIAVLLFAFYESNNNLLTWRLFFTATDQLLTTFINKNKQTYALKERIITCECNLIIDSTLQQPPAVQLKLGYEGEQLFVIKNIYHFLIFLTKHALDSDYIKGYKISQKFTFYPNKSTLSPFAEKVIKFLQQEFINVSSFLQTQKMDFYGVSITKSFGFSSSQTDQFLSHIKGETIKLIIDGEEYSDVKISVEQYQPSLSIQQKDNVIQIINKKENPIILTSSQQSLFDAKQIFLLNHKDTFLLGPIYQTMVLTKHNKIIFTPQQTNDVIKEIVALLDYPDNTIQIDPIILNSLEKTPLVIESYFDFKNKEIMLRPLFRYGAITFDLLNKSNNDNKIVLRNVYHEQEYLTFCKQLGFVQKGHYFILNELEHVLKLLSKDILTLEKLSQIFYTDNFKNVRLIDFKVTSSRINVNQNNDWLEFDFKLSKLDYSDLGEILNAINHNQKYYQLTNGSIIDLQEQTLQKFATLINQFNFKQEQFAQGKLQVSKYHALTVYNNLDLWAEFNCHFNLDFDHLITKIKHLEQNEFSVPTSLTSMMCDFQKKGYFWLKTLASLGFGGILADEMGLGKTLQTISFILKEYELNQQMAPVLIIVPAALIYNWKTEIDRFAPMLQTLVIAGERKTREMLFTKITQGQVVITSYPLLRRDIHYYQQIFFQYCFLDEAQYIKNPHSINAKLVNTLKTGIRFALTGTPIENNLTELWSIFNFILPGFLLQHQQFQKRYEIPIIREQNEAVKKELLQKIAPFILRRLKQGVMSELPPKIENKILVEMTVRQKKIYAAYANAAREEINKILTAGQYQQNRLKIFATLTKLRQICCDPSILDKKYQNESAKLDALRDIFDDLAGSGHKILIFSQFTTVLKRIKAIVEEIGLQYFYLDGKTRSESRVLMTQKFNEDKIINVFLISLKAGGVGLNLTAADVVIHFDPWWNPSVENQATDRAHRFGQQNTVQVIKLIAKGTIEEKILTIQNNKQEVINAVLNNNSENANFTKLSEAELRNILEL
ncbi:DEAD/DEAH box helicase [Spiroplasma citri]|uniref:DEAD/DEAH box helicase n=1 Tax=Spiroplasma citri TaxID=2133 RepID=A0AAX3T1M4_SPICI|nr:DEAD/DEAH box helicase [Spiroplasma citri]WFG97173.1 DEAD/DEAH box helicase [Spiroplasma citri]WFH01070.1 DEAD/DEAH box helicase [Spiroplasma citri]